MAIPTIIFLPAPGLNDLTVAQYNAGVWEILPLHDTKLRSSDMVIALAPGTDARILPLNLSVRNENDARRAASFAIEDDIASSVETLHLAISQTGSDGKRREAVICDMELMSHWAELLDAAGYHSVPVYSELSLLPERPLALEIQDRLLVRDENGRVFAIDATMPREVVHALLPGGELELHGQTLADLFGRDVSGTSGLDRLAELAEADGNVINLRQGRFALRRQSDFDWRAFRWPASLAAAAVLSWTIGTGLETRALNNQTEQLQAEARRIYQAAYPGEPVPRNLLQALATEKSQSKSDINVLDAAADLYSALIPLDTASIRSLRFNRKTGELQAGLIYSAYGDELKVKADLEAKDYQVTLGDTRQANGLVIGDVTLEGGT